MIPAKPAIAARVALAATAALAALTPALGGCRGERFNKPPKHLFPDMDDQQRWDAQEATDFFGETSRTALPQVNGTVAFGYESFDPLHASDEPWAASWLVQRAGMLAAEQDIYEGTTTGPDGSVQYIDDIPVAVTMATLERGEERFNIHCATCHGYVGNGESPVASYWSYPVPNLLGEVYRDKSQRQGKDGYLFHVVLEGVWDPATGANRMPGYKHAVSEMDAWAIVAYLRALQASQQFRFEDLPEPEQQRLAAVRGAPNTSPATPPTAPAPDQAPGSEQPDPAAPQQQSGPATSEGMQQ